MATARAKPDPADRITLDDSVRLALPVVLEKLSPAERAVFVLHDVFRYPFAGIAGLQGRPAARPGGARDERRPDQRHPLHSQPPHRWPRSASWSSRAAA